MATTMYNTAQTTQMPSIAYPIMNDLTINAWLTMNNFPSSIEADMKKFNIYNTNQIKYKSDLEIMHMLNFITASDSFSNQPNLIVPFKSAIYNVHLNTNNYQTGAAAAQQQVYGGYGGYGTYGAFGYGGHGAYNISGGWDPKKDNNGADNSSDWSSINNNNSSGGGWSNHWSANNMGDWGGNNDNQLNNTLNSNNETWGICWDFANGHCERGNTCSWSHGTADTIENTTNTSCTTNKQELECVESKPWRVCWDYQSTGYCDRGDQCKWLHSTETKTIKANINSQNNENGKENESENNKQDVEHESEIENDYESDHDSDNEVINEMDLENKITPGNDDNEQDKDEYKQECDEENDDMAITDKEEKSHVNLNDQEKVQKKQETIQKPIK